MSDEKPKGPLDSDTDDSDFRAEGSSAEGAEDFEDNESSLEEMEEDEFEGLDLEKPPSSVVTIEDEEEEDESKTSKESKASKENAKPKKKARKPNSRPASKCVTFADDEDEDDEVDLPPDVPKSIDHYMPLIFWHDKKPINSVHVQQVAPPDQFVSDEGRRADLRYKICTTSTQQEVRVWELTFTKSRKPGAEDKFELGVNFVANLDGHQAPLSMAKYSPDGNLIASADMNGQLCIWKIEPRPADFVLPKERPITDESAQFTIPPNKENWQRAGMPMRCDSDISVLTFSPCSQFVCTASLDDLSMFSVKGARKWQQRNARHLICGMTWDPTGRYIVCMSNARRLDIFDAAKGHRLRTCYQVTIPPTVVDRQEYPEDSYKLFFDQHVITLSRTPDFSPCGELLFAPAGQLESADAFTYGTYVFRRCDLDRCLPFAFYPSEKPTWTVAVSPVRYELRTDTEENICGLPYRLVFAVMCPESILFYDSQTAKPIGFVYDLTYDNLTSISWTPDGKVLAISSNEAFNMFLHIRTDELVPTDLRIERCASPPLRKLKDENADAKTPKSAPAADGTSAKAEGAQKTPTRAANSTAAAAASDATTPKAKPKMRKIQTFFTPTTPEAPKEAAAKEEEPKEEKS